MPYYPARLLVWKGCHCTILTCADGMVTALEHLMANEQIRPLWNEVWGDVAKITGSQCFTRYMPPG
ncbi:hypothetical protein [Microvirga zambiensis]|uniref:hypothetical protein n=1 Tax=Microvirga zambiensis TaxID=1402137 RepID=UPI00191DC978|nr:hypothetical protein [Microvirga zambiensis]